MNPTSEDVKDMLVAESSLGLAFATNLFVGREPTTPDDCTTVYDTVGYPPAITFDGNGDYYYPSVQIRVRNRSYLDGLELIQHIVEALHGRHNETWNGTLYTTIVCQNDPGILDWDENNRVRFIVNFNLQRR
jgi:hypothetical protein